jgi:hypothetical protein
MRRKPQRIGHIEFSSHSRGVLGMFQNVVDVETIIREYLDVLSFLVCMNVRKYWGLGT